MMKLPSMNRGRLVKKRAPLRLFQELADEFGLTIPQLRGHMGASELDPPKAVLVSRSHHGTRKSYYDLSEMRAWWKRKTGAK